MENRSPIAVAVIVENANQILLIKEAKGTAQGKWNQPAGRFEVGENIKQAALREAKEETGYTIELKSLVGIYDELENQSKPRVRFVFTAKLLSNSQDKFSEDIAEVKWVSREELLAINKDGFASDATYQSFQDFLTGKNYPLDIFSW